jgi:hypothetical protein
MEHGLDGLNGFRADSKNLKGRVLNLPLLLITFRAMLVNKGTPFDWQTTESQETDAREVILAALK